MVNHNSPRCPGAAGRDRVRHLTRHLTNAEATEASRPNWGSFAADLAKVDRDQSGESKEQFMKVVAALPNAIENLDYNIADFLPGPLSDKERYPNGWFDVYADMRKWQLTGEMHIGISELQKRYGGAQGLGANIVVPHVKFGRDGPNDSGRRSIPEVTQEVIVANPHDARRIARMHVKKNPLFTPMFYNSIISTTDQEEWRVQREHLVGCFLPKGSLQEIFPVTLQRAKDCAKRLEALRTDPNTEEGPGLVNMNDFLLYETEAQLQLALFGLDSPFMEETNEKFRAAMAGKIDAMYARQFCDELMLKIESDHDISGPVSSGVQASCPVKGPLSDGLRTMTMDGYGTKGNAFIFAFAGHDTTGHTLSWLMFELARHPDIQKRLQQEVDEFFKELDGRDMTYQDLTKLPFMTRCIMETLRYELSMCEVVEIWMTCVTCIDCGQLFQTELSARRSSTIRSKARMEKTWSSRKERWCALSTGADIATLTYGGPAPTSSTRIENFSLMNYGMVTFFARTTLKPNGSRHSLSLLGYVTT